METSTIAAYRSKWNARYQETTHVPEPHPLAARVRHRFTGGPMLDAACGLGRGVALAAEHFAPLYAMDISDVAVARAKARWGDGAPIRWIVGDVTALPWPRDYFGLVCALGFTDHPFFARMARSIRPGGMMLFEGFSARHLEVKPDLDPEWTSTPEQLAADFPGWEVLVLEETEALPHRWRYAAVRPAA